jgi:ATP-dependent RNA circularization protein (DNA/RNA ligase family)
MQKTNRQSFIVGDYAQPEFRNIKFWRVEEKIDGTNIRIILEKDSATKLIVKFCGRTADAQIPCHLLNKLQYLFTPEKLVEVFPTLDDGVKVILFGEGYGPKIQKGGGKYANEPGFILFDVVIGNWWLKRNDIAQIANRLDIPCVPSYGYMTEEEIIAFVKQGPISILNTGYGRVEGVVCKTEPLLLCRNGEPLMFKFKCKEFDQ